MAVKELLARVQHKRDTSANWEAQDPVLLNGEVIIVDTTDGKTRTKTGDGQKKYSQLSFDNEITVKPYIKTFTASEWYNGTLTIPVSEHQKELDEGIVLSKVFMLSGGVYSAQCLVAMDTEVSVSADKSIVLSYDGAGYAGKVILYG